MLGAKPGERILDLGCGDGALTAEIKALGAHVLGVDLSDELLAVARMKGLNVRKVDGHALDFVSEFDAVFSNAALHWMRKPHLVIAGVARALRPRGRFVGVHSLLLTSLSYRSRCCIPSLAANHFLRYKPFHRLFSRF